MVGNAIHDTAVLSGAVGPTGTITFSLYATADCSGQALFTDTRTVNGNGSYGPVTFTPDAIGTYHWIASYGGDGNNAPIAGACGDAGENDTVIKASPAIVTTANESVVVGNAINDTATLAGGVSPTGTITFNLYGPNDCHLHRRCIFTSTVTVNGNGTYPRDDLHADQRRHLPLDRQLQRRRQQRRRHRRLQRRRRERHRSRRRLRPSSPRPRPR